MSAAAYLSTLGALEGLYESVVNQPEQWGEQAFADWAGETLVDGAELSKEAMREVRRGLRAAQKLQSFWMASGSRVPDHGDWESKVDIALGARAWRPLLDLARIGLAAAPDPELFEQVKTRFALVNTDRWMDGVDYEEWLEKS